MNIVSVSKVVPYEGIPHAGGEYYLRHLETLVALGHSVTVLAPRDQRNIDAIRKYALAADVVLFGPPRRSFWGRGVDRLERELAPGRLPSSFLRSLANAPRVESALADADLLEVQWTEMASIINHLSCDLPPVILVAHDIIHQRESRKLTSLSRHQGVARLIQRFRVRSALRDELRAFGVVSCVLVFSAKDAQLARSLAPQVDVEVLQPPLGHFSHGSEVRARPREQRRNVVFVGAFGRPENIEGAEWLTERVWPLVRKEAPTAELSLVGSDPRGRIARLASSDRAIQVTGYVPDLEPFYSDADVAVVPLLRGAGVKFKTVDAILRGVPVVTTSVGAEGIGEELDELPFAVEDTVCGFARAIVTALGDPTPTVHRRALEAQYWALDKYGVDRFTSALSAILFRVSGRE